MNLLIIGIYTAQTPFGLLDATKFRGPNDPLISFIYHLMSNALNIRNANIQNKFFYNVCVRKL